MREGEVDIQGKRSSRGDIFGRDDPPRSHPRVRFDDFEFDCQSRELRFRGESVPLQPQPSRLLTLLVESPGRLITREEIRQCLWPDSKVEFDANINFCIKQIRAALGDQPDAPLYIKTIPRRGYRFVGEATIVNAVAGDSARARPRRGRAMLWIAATGLALVVAGGVALRGAGGRDRAIRLAVLPITPVGDAASIQQAADGATRAIVTRLGELDSSRLRVVAHEMVRTMLAESDDLAALAQSRNIDLFVSGSMQRETSQWRIAAQLVHAPDQTILWSTQLMIPVDEPMRLQDEIADRIYTILEEHITDGDAAPDMPTTADDE